MILRSAVHEPSVSAEHELCVRVEPQVQRVRVVKQGRRRTELVQLQSIDELSEMQNYT